MGEPTITVEESYDTTTVYFSGIPHLIFVRREVVGLQAWKSNAVYSIEITFREGAAILTEYDDREKWSQVLTLIKERLTP